MTGLLRGCHLAVTTGRYINSPIETPPPIHAGKKSSPPFVMHHRAKFLSLFLAFPIAAKAEVVINEIMYHPASENPAEEYIELYNTGGAAVNVSGWQFTSGISFTVPPATSIP